MDFTVYALIPFSGFFLGLVSILILVFVRRPLSYPNRMLSLCLLSLTYLMFVTTLVESDAILKLPHFFRTASPVIYLIAPSAFLYVRAVLEEESRFRLIDGLHFLPALLHFFELVPFYLRPAEVKVEMLRIIQLNLDQELQLQEGILPAYFHAYLKPLLGLVYFTVQIRLIWKYVKENKTLDTYQKAIVYWLSWLTLILTVCYVLLLLTLLSNSPEQTIHHLLTSLISFALLSIVMYLFFSPQILYGLSNYSESKNLVEEILDQQEDRNLLPPEKVAAYQLQIEEYLEQEKPYLNTDFRMRTMEEDTGIPRHHLSAVINNLYGKNFNRLINEHRVNYIQKHFNDPEWSNLTIEGIGMEAGFKSRSTFLQAFKKITGMTPSEFREQAS